MAKILEVTTVGITARAFLVPLFQELKALGHDVDYAATPDDDAKIAAQSAQVPFYPVPISRSISPRDIKSIYTLYKLIKANKYDVVHTHTAKAGFAGRFAAWLAGVPTIIHTAHGLTVHPGLSPLKKRIYLFLERFIAKKTHAFIAVTDLVRDELEKQKIAAPDKVTVIPNFVSPACDPNKIAPQEKSEIQKLLSLPSDARAIGCAARLVEDKGLEETISALSRLKQNTWLVIAGDGPKKAQLENLAYAKGVRSRIRFLGWVDNAKMPALLSQLDYFVAATKREGFGVGLLEAQAMGLPLVTSKIRPLTDLIPPDSAILIDVKTPQTTEDGIVSAIEALQSDPKKASTLSAKAIQNAARYSESVHRQSLRRFFMESRVS